MNLKEEKMAPTLKNVHGVDSAIRESLSGRPDKRLSLLSSESAVPYLSFWAILKTTMARRMRCAITK